MFELHIYELLKFVVKSINNFHSDEFLNSIVTFHNLSSTRSSCLNLLIVPSFKTKIQRPSIQYRSTILYNKLGKFDIMPDLIGCSYKEVNDFYYTFKTTFLINNFELVRYVFSVRAAGIFFVTSTFDLAACAQVVHQVVHDRLASLVESRGPFHRQ